MQQLPTKLTKLNEGVASALSLVQSDFGLLSTYYFEQFEEGIADPVKMYIAFKKMEKFVETILPFIKDQMNVEHFTEAYKAHGVSLQKQNTRDFYNFNHCEDPKYNAIIEEMEAWKEELKNRENFLKSLGSAIEIVDEETGETNIINPPIKKSGTTVVLRYDKD